MNPKTFKAYFNHTYSSIKTRCLGKRKTYVSGFKVLSADQWKQFLEDTAVTRLGLYLAWKMSGYNRRLSPSIDRIDPRQGYIEGNIRWIPSWVNSSLSGTTSPVKNVCRNGHPWNEENLYVDPRKRRTCRLCKEVFQKAWREKNSESIKVYRKRVWALRGV